MNSLAPVDTLREGQPLFVPPTGTNRLGAVYFFVCIPNRDTLLRLSADDLAPGSPISKGEVLFVYGKPVGDWYAVPLQSSLWPRVPAPPRTIQAQRDLGRSVPLDQLQPGDRLYFHLHPNAQETRAGSPGTPDHTGIYVSGGYFIPAAPPEVAVTRLAGRYLTGIVAVRRNA